MVAESSAPLRRREGLATIPGPRDTLISPLRLAGGRVSAILHAPASGTPDRVGIICPPVFYEHQLCHRTLRSLAERLAAAGAFVLRLDYRGTGDSSPADGAAGPASWGEDVAAGAAFLTAELGRAPAFYLGLRAGATVALQAAVAGGAGGESAPAVYAWAPVLDGAAYAAELERTHLAWFTGYARQHRRSADLSSRSERVLGESWPPETRRRVASLGPPAAGTCDGTVVLIESAGEELAPADRAALAAVAPRSTVLEVPGPAPWRQDPDITSPAVPAGALDAIARCVGAGGSQP